MRKKIISNENGLTLIEVIMALSLSVMLLVPLSTMWIDSTRDSKYAWEQTLDMSDAQKVFTEIIEGSKGNRIGLKHATAYQISSEGIAFAVEEVILGYYHSNNNLYKITDLENVDDPLTGGEVILESVESFEVTPTDGLLYVVLKTQKHLGVGSTFETKVRLRRLGYSPNE